MAMWSKKVFAKNLTWYMDNKGINQKELADIVGVSPPTVNEWLKSKKYPRIDKIEIMANYFGILKSDLIEDKSDEYKQTQKKNDIQADIILKMRSNPIFMSVAETLYKFDDDKLQSINQMLNTLIK